MNLKNYQRETLDVLRRYFEATQFKSPELAYAEVASTRDIRLRLGRDYGYANPAGLERVPTVCIKVPTGGGKTILAAHALKLIAAAQGRDFPLVLWFAPSDAIRRQTAEALKRPAHPYRRELDAAFGGHVRVFDLDERAILAPEDLARNLCLVVSTTQAFVHKETNRYNVYRHSEDFERHFGGIPLEPGMEAQDDDPAKPKFSFANLVLHHHPVVIIDEAHHMVTDLSKAALARLAPSAVMGLTATPDRNNNTVYAVYAEELFREEMVKLPIELTEHRGSWEDAVAAALAKRRELAEDAAKEAAAGGGFVHPILLFQATSKTGPVPVERLKTYLVETLKIPEGEIRVATGEQKELDDIDVMSPACGVHYIITVQALKEGWDCPFAYVFCSLANVGSSTDTIQLLGRVMRMPYARRRKTRSLNRAYAHVMSAEFGAAARELTEGLKAKGFGADEAAQSVELQVPVQQELGPLFAASPDTVSVAGDVLDAVDVPSGVTVRDKADGSGEIALTGHEDAAAIRAFAAALAQKGAAGTADELTRKFARKKAEVDEPVPAAGHPMRFPRLAAVVDGETLFSTDETWETVGESVAAFLKPAFAPGDIGARADDGRTFVLTLDGNEMTYRFSAAQDAPFLKGFSGALAPGDVVNVLDGLTKDYDLLLQGEKRHWLTGIVADLLVNKGLTCEQLVLARHQVRQRLDYYYAEAIAEARRRAYQAVFAFGTKHEIRLDLARGFAFDEHVYDGPFKRYAGSYRFRKHYLGPHRVPAFDGTGVGEEFACAQKIDANGQVAFWLRNLANDAHRSFRLPVATAESSWFYSDFIGQLTDGRLFVLEYKGKLTGQDRDTIEKDAVGRLWAAQDRAKYVYATIYGPERDGKTVEQQIAAAFGAS